MVALREVREIDIRATTNGVDQAKDKLDGLARADDAVVAAGERLERSTASVGRSLERWNRTLDGNYASSKQLEKATRDLADAQARGLISVDRHNQLLGAAQIRYGAVSDQMKGVNDNTKLASHEIGLMGAQFMDLGTQIASGGGLFLPIIQQGGQLAGQLGDRGLKGAVGALGSGLLAFVTNPLNLAVLALAGAGAAASLFLSTVGDGAKSTEDIFKEHEDIIGRIGDRYGDATAAARDYAEESTAILRRAAEQSAAALREQLANQSQALLSQLGTSVQAQRPEAYGQIANGFDQPLFSADARFAPFKQQIEDLTTSIAAGTPKITEFREAVNALAAANPGNGRMRQLADELLTLTDEASKTARALPGAAAALQALSGAASDGVPSLRTYADSVKAITDLVPALAAQQKVISSLAAIDGNLANALAKSAALGGSEGAIAARAAQLETAAQRARDAVTGLTDAQDKAKTSLEAYTRSSIIAGMSPREAAIARETDAYGRQIEMLRAANAAQAEYDKAAEAHQRNLSAISGQYGADGNKLRRGQGADDLLRDQQAQIEALQLETRLIGTNAEERGKLVARLQAEQDMRSRGINLLSAEADEIRANAEAIAGLNTEYARKQLMDDIAFDRAQLGRNSVDQQIAATQRSAGLEVDLESADAEAMRLNATLAATKDIAGDAMSGFVRDIRNGVDAMDALENAAERALDTILEMATQNLTAGLFGEGSGSGGGILGSILSAFTGGGGGANGTAGTMVGGSFVPTTGNPWAGLGFADGGRTGRSRYSIQGAF
ncbi:phage tail length tape measure family protein [Ancylobacter sp. FA202]|uniref:phage tail length tape measure family protein n=1 Tax=Ancylobacter sp. FA202 TaxID=1111106 RepID=UPI000378967B|nr:phage tail length tape measure family protein [Ancylobacter sp. FA202]